MYARGPKLVGLRLKMPSLQKVKLVGSLQNYTFWGQLSRNPEVRTSKFCSSPQNYLHASDVWKITKIALSEVSRFRGQSTGKIKVAEIVVRGAMFDSPYLDRQTRYSRYFTAIDSPPTCLQGDQKSSACGWKCPHYRRSNLRDRSKLSCEGLCLTPHISAVNRDIPDILQWSIVCQHLYKVTKNRRSTSENAPTTEGQTCGIAPKLHFLGAIISEPWSQNFKIL